MARLMEDYCEMLGASLCIVFIDIIAAVYSVLRQLVVGMDCSDEHIAALLQRLPSLPKSSLRTWQQSDRVDRRGRRRALTLGAYRHIWELQVVLFREDRLEG